MTRQEKFTNDAETTLNGGITAGATTLTLTSATGFDTEGDYRILIDEELMLVTAVSGMTATVTRAIEGTTGVTHANGATITRVLTSGAIDDWIVDRDPWANLRRPYRILDASGDPLTQSDFTKINVTERSGTLTDQGRFITMKTDSNSVSQISAAVRSAPSAPYTLYMAMTYMALSDDGANGTMLGLVLRESATDKFSYWTLRPGATQDLRIITQTGVSGVGTTRYQDGIGTGHMPIWFSLNDTGTVLNYGLSTDGYNFLTILSANRTTHFTTAPDEIGFCINNVDATSQSPQTLVAWHTE
jgi:hypothetical protein